MKQPHRPRRAPRRPNLDWGDAGRIHRAGSSGSAEAAAHPWIAAQPRSLLILVAEASGWLTAPIRNETPCFPRLIGTKTPAFGACAERITKSPYLKQHLKTIENWLPEQSPGCRS